MKIRQHRLIDDAGSPVEFQRSPNQSGAISPEYLVIHFTKGASASSSVSWLVNPDARASAHLVIGRDGGITQLVAFNRKAWHAGRSRWAGRSGLNSCSIGIELDNRGDLVGAPGGWRTSWGRSVPDDEVVELAHSFDGQVRGWHVYSEEQLMTTARVGVALVRHYGLKEVLGHDDIAPGRKLDPGPAFPMASYRSAVLGRGEEDEITHRTTAALNIRTGPGTRHEKLPVSPLPAGTRLDVLETRGLWHRVDVLDAVGGEMDVVGWVHGGYVEVAT